MRSKSIQTKLIIFIIPLLLFISVALSLFFMFRSKHLLEDQLTSMGHTLAKNLSYSSRLGIASEDEIFLKPYLEGISREDDVVFVALYNKRGELIAKKSKVAMEERIDGAILAAIAGKNSVQRVLPSSSEHDDIYDFYSAVFISDILAVRGEPSRQKFAGVARVAVSGQLIKRQINEIFLVGSITMLLVVLLGVALSYGLARKLVSPVRELTRGTELIGRGNLKHRIHIDTGDEVEELAHSFNMMAANLARSQEQLEQANVELERKVQERTGELVQSAKMAGIGTMAGGVAHEINNPLVAILGSVQMLLLDERTEEDHKLLELIEKAANRCRDIVRVLLRYSRKANHQKFGSLDVNETLDDACQLLEAQLQQDNIRIHRQFGAVPRVHGNQNEIQQVFTNLVTNGRDAILAAAKPGNIMLKTFGEDGHVVIEITDDGCGMGDEEMARIFDPFFTTKAPGKGTGLGLSVVSQIIEAHNGKISVSSTVGKGTTLTVKLPMEHDPAG